jgi:hypothetical protein
MKVNWLRAALAGIVGTVAFDLAGLVLLQTFWDLPALLGSKIVGEGGLALPVGVAAHYGNGVVLAILYAAIEPSLWGNRWARALTFMTAQTVFGIWLFMLPLLGAGVMGIKMGGTVWLITLLRHWAYAVPLVVLSPLQHPEPTPRM